LPQRAPVVLEPRKSPVQARSVASVDAILKATIQVLLRVGKEGLTTTRVALRAGVSVGTLYQYFPNKKALLQAALKRHLAEVAEAVELVCRQQEGRTLRQMATALITAFLSAKMRAAKTSIALYSVSSDVDGAKIVKEMGSRVQKAIVRMLRTASDPFTTDPQLVAAMLQASMSGVIRMLLESSTPEEQFDTLREELIFAACTYLDACSARGLVQRPHAVGIARIPQRNVSIEEPHSKRGRLIPTATPRT
jgi:AcrR family transcriptional regulator